MNSPSGALGCYESGDLIPLVVFKSERLPLFTDVPTLIEAGEDFAYYMQWAVVGIPGMSDDALAYHTALFDQVYRLPEWQKYKTDKSLFGDYLAGENLKDDWPIRRDRHETISESVRGHQVGSFGSRGFYRCALQKL